ncbi:uncharacterized protein LOC131225826 isoform X2 [Magnolia sinica]|uniref:uncharacterized protein LOC131225826 isoform X2 n=1 Tax=Magnolia sinica TaxID=86752 RepID=UPI00265B0896|nr:uncharacterized protein LOC131225826 isoform X2 [Magnolia sinica]
MITKILACLTRYSFWFCFLYMLLSCVAGTIVPMLEAVIAAVHVEKLAVQFHDTYGQSLSNILISIQVKSATELASRGLLVDEVEAMAVVGLLQFVDILQSSMKSALKEDLYWCAATLSFFNKQLFGSAL